MLSFVIFTVTVLCVYCLCNIVFVHRVYRDANYVDDESKITGLIRKCPIVDNKPHRNRRQREQKTQQAKDRRTLIGRAVSFGHLQLPKTIQCQRKRCSERMAPCLCLTFKIGQ